MNEGCGRLVAQRLELFGDWIRFEQVLGKPCRFRQLFSGSVWGMQRLSVKYYFFEIGLQPLTCTAIIVAPIFVLVCNDFEGRK